MTKNVAAIICAAGTSSRFGGKRKKPFVDVGGRAAFLRSVELFTDRNDVKQVILAIAPEDEEIVRVKWGANLTFFGVEICLGGKERYETVQKALQRVKEDIQLVAVHDAARCCITDDLVGKVIHTAAQKGAAILASPLVGTIKEVVDGAIKTTIDRSRLYEAQTPQVFGLALLKRAYENLKNIDPAHISDDAQLIEALGKPVAIVKSDPSNIKITYQSDVAMAEAIINSRPKTRPEGPIGPYNEAQW